MVPPLEGPLEQPPHHPASKCLDKTELWDAHLSLEVGVVKALARKHCPSDLCQVRGLGVWGFRGVGFGGFSAKGDPEDSEKYIGNRGGYGSYEIPIRFVRDSTDVLRNANLSKVNSMTFS